MLATHSLLFQSDLGPDAADDLAELREWLDLAAFVQAERLGLIGRKPERDFRVRPLWRDVLACVERIERTRAAAILTGTYEAEPTRRADRDRAPRGALAPRQSSRGDDLDLVGGLPGRRMADARRLCRRGRVTASEPRPIDRFTGAFVEELGKRAARAVIALEVAVASGYILLPT